MHNALTGWIKTEPGQLPLVPREIQVWLIDLDFIREDISWLSPYQCEQYRKLPSNNRILRRFVAACARRVILTGVLHLPEDTICFKRDICGKPYLAGNMKTNVRFNISHSGKYALLAIRCKREVGVDIEFHSPFRNIKRIIKILHPNEQCILESITDPVKHKEAFFELWTCKEAYLKATGLGLRRGLRSLKITNFLEDIPEGKKHRTLTPLTSNWCVLPLNCPMGYSGALVAEGNCWHVRTAFWVPS